MEFKQLKNILEAALLASSTPMSIARLSALFDEDEKIANSEIGKAVEALREDCEGRGVELVEVASGFRYQVRQDVYEWVAKMWTERPSRYSRALLETLALIAYRQPITRGEIESVRGVTVSSSIIKTLEEREWIRLVGHRDVPGRPGLYGTTREFLDYFNLRSLDELPSLAEIRDMEEFDPQLNLDGDKDSDNKEATAHAALPDAEPGAETESDADVGEESSERAAPANDESAEETGESTEDTSSNTEQDAADDHIEKIETVDESTAPQATADEAQAHADDEPVAAETDTEENRA
ncbi:MULTISPECIES: SMC-Scp complex subunit ScpB [Oleiagrimonas]|jgi:segregation and condensation protein B|uniref:SMC-Scp complex subunit ScpB n=1 Tax=Oleiagrimonas citrea TaxID=1665687 RepID=A0A846ZNS1_9GAMM|nr:MULTISPECIES: SMC-Scp complex subunit ScpB [Oleiagrimonas]NKZ39210.1 SMC-Scp complex subunit ScpB [Oleiagrimonas citrea]RAP57806.1 SMC-Scp complex subunit ScpB [Oleiagrimonas sp. MCCC 1A03011]